jgi:CRISPR-associated RAMP protein (TIGR02581 family)
MADFYRFENRTAVTATLVMQTALSVGSRTSFLPAGSDLPVMKTPEGIPYIPGSSLKGVVRAYLERLLRTMDALGKQVHGERLWACDPLEESGRCVTSQRKKKLIEDYPEDAKLTRQLYTESCTACRLFGSPWLASRVAFQDARLLNAEALLRLTEVRDGVGIDRDLGVAKTRIKYDFETVPAGARFGISIVVENAEVWEIGLLMMALETMRNTSLPLGGKTTRGLGWGTLSDLRVERIEAGDLLDWLAEAKQPTRLEAQSLLEQLRSVLQ